MSTLVAAVAFVPSPVSPFQFQATLDGEAYTITILWNLFGQRYYVNIASVDGVRILTTAMVGSPLDYDISLTANHFTTKLVWRPAMRQFEIIEP